MGSSATYAELAVCEGVELSPVAGVWEKILVDGWVLLPNTSEFGFDPTFFPYVNERYFGEHGILQPETYKHIYPPDRKRALGALSIDFDDEGLVLLEDKTQAKVVNENRGEWGEERTYHQHPLAGDTRFTGWLANLTEYIPPPIEKIPEIILDEEDGRLDPNILFEGPFFHESYALWDEKFNHEFYLALTGNLSSPAETTAGLLRRLSSLLGFETNVHFFEVYRDAVSGPHRDNTYIVAITVPAKNCNGAVSELYRPDDLKNSVLRYTLQPGETLIFDDRRFLHNVTPLEPPEKGECFRRAIVCTFDVSGL